MMQTIVFFSGDITRRGGTERVAVRLANALAGRNPEWSIAFLSLTEEEKEPFFPLAPGIRRHHLSDHWISPGPSYLPLIKKVRTFLSETKADVVIDVDIVLDSLSVPAVKPLKTKVISWEHFDFSFEMGVLYRRMILMLCTKKAWRIVALTGEGKRQLKRYLKRERGILALPNPCPDRKTKPQSERGKELLTVGHLERVKGTDLLLQTAKVILPKFPDWKWIVAGDGVMEEDARAFAKREGLEKQLVFTGSVPDVEPYYDRAAVYVCPSRSEGFPMTILEARSAGLPVIAFAMPGTKELVEDGGNGCLLPMEDTEALAQTLAELMQDEKRRKNLAEKASEGLEQYSIEGICKRWEQLLE